MRITHLVVSLFLTAACVPGSHLLPTETVHNWFVNPQSYVKPSQDQAQEIACNTVLLEDIVGKLSDPDPQKREMALRVLTDIQSQFSISKQDGNASAQASSDTLLLKFALALPSLLADSMDLSLIAALPPPLMVALHVAPVVVSLWTWMHSEEEKKPLPREVWEAYRKSLEGQVSPDAEKLMRQALEATDPQPLACRDLWPETSPTLNKRP